MDRLAKALLREVIKHQVAAKFYRATTVVLGEALKVRRLRVSRHSRGVLKVEVEAEVEE